MPGRYGVRTRYAAACGDGNTWPLNTYGFSTVFTSIASPYAWADHCGGPFATAYRQLKDDVLSAAVDAGSLAPNAEIGIIVRIGKWSANNVRKTCVIAGTTDAATTSVPMCGFASNPQYVMVRLRNCAGPTGHPACQLLPSCAAVTVAALATNTAGTTAAWLVGDGWLVADGAGFGCADALGVVLGVLVGVGVGVGVGVRVGVGVGLAGATDTCGATAAGAIDDGAGSGELATASVAEVDPASLVARWLLVQPAASSPMITLTASTAVRHDALSSSPATVSG